MLNGSALLSKWQAISSGTVNGRRGNASLAALNGRRARLWRASGGRGVPIVVFGSASLWADPTASTGIAGIRAAASATSAKTCAGPLSAPLPSALGVLAAAATAPAPNIAHAAMAGSHRTRQLLMAASTGTTMAMSPPVAKTTKATGIDLTSARRQETGFGRSEKPVT